MVLTTPGRTTNAAASQSGAMSAGPQGTPTPPARPTLMDALAPIASRHTQIKPPPSPSAMRPRRPNAAELRGVAETALISLAARAVAPKRFPHLRFRDPLAEAAARDLRLDVERYADTDQRSLDIIARSWILDELVGGFTSRFANAQILNLGAGLTTQFHRMDNGFMTWIDVDLPEIVELRNALLPSRPRQRSVASDLNRQDWAQSLPLRKAPTLVLIEGVTMFLDPAVVRRLFDDLAAITTGLDAELVFDFVPKALCGRPDAINAVVRGRNEAGGKPVLFRWGIRRDRELNAGVKEWTLVRNLPIEPPAQAAPRKLMNRLLNPFGGSGPRRGIAQMRRVPDPA